MSLTQVDRKPALIIFDQQKYNLALDVDYVLPVEDVIARTAQLAGEFRRRGWPVVYMKVPNAYGIELMRQGTQPGGRVELGYVKTFSVESTDTFPDGWHDIVDELAPEPQDIVLTKPFWDSFVGTSLDYELRQRGITQVFVTGLMAAIGVESTCRTANNLGYNTVPVVDAMSDFDKDAYNNSVEKIFPRVGEPCTTAEALAKIAEV